MFPLILVVFSLLLLGAHFLRDGTLAVVVLPVVVLPALLIVRRPWAARVVQLALLLGTLKWIRTLVQSVNARIETGQPFARLAIILGVVAAITLLSALAFQFGSLGRAYGIGKTERD